MQIFGHIFKYIMKKWGKIVQLISFFPIFVPKILSIFVDENQ